MQINYYPENSSQVILISFIIIIILEIIWVASIIIAPLIIGTEGIAGQAGIAVYGLFSPLCHQIDDRCFHIDGNKFAVCSRCFGIYTGFLIGTVLYPLIYRGEKFLKMPGLKYFIIPVGILFADVILDYADVFPNTFITRTATGGLIGLISAFFIIPGLIIFVLEIYKYIKEFKN